MSASDHLSGVQFGGEDGYVLPSILVMALSAS